MTQLKLLSHLKKIFFKEIMCGVFQSDVQSRPNSASIISQSDDVLTSGEYSEYYTNLQQIGKGAFGYVKMAYRNHDGLLVSLKFFVWISETLKNSVGYYQAKVRSPLA